MAPKSISEKIIDPRNDLASLLQRALSTLDIAREVSELRDLIEVPRDPSHGDFAFPCFSLAKELRQAPAQIAHRFAQEQVAPLLVHFSLIASVAATGPYLNFRLHQPALAAELIPSVLDGSFLKTRPPLGCRIMLEYSQPNTHKAFHVGHCRNASLGDSLARIFTWLGNDVVPVNYLGDEGTHVAKCIWYLLNYHHGDIPRSNRGEFLGRLYAKATELLDLNCSTKLPFPGIVVAKVLEVAPHPNEPKWRIAKIDIGSTEKTVVCGGQGFASGDLVAYAPPGTRLAGRTVGVLDKKGVVSEGMICSERELEISDDGDAIMLLPVHGSPGMEIAEVARFPDKLPEDVPILQTIRQREAEVSALLQKLEAGDPELKELWLKTKQWSLDEYHEIYRWLDCRFERDFFESEFGESSKELVREYFEKGIFVESDGAIGADLSEYGLGFCLLIKRDGTALYATRDLSLARKKFEEFNVDRSVYVVDSGQTLHFQQVFKCLELMGYERAKDCYHVSYAQVVRPDGKMSSRKGNVVLFSDLVSRLVEKITSEFLSNFLADWSQSEIVETANLIARATVRYGMLTQDNNSQVIFDLDEWTSKSGNTGPYMLYACARIQSILRESQNLNLPEANWDLLAHQAEADLLLHMLEFPRVVSKAGETYSPHLISAYVYELSKRFSRFYHDCSVLNAESAALKASRVALVKSVLAVLKHGLDLLGITTVARM